MRPLRERSAAELADALDEMADFPHNTGGLSMLDEATLEFGRRYPTVGPAQRTFASARHTTERGIDTDETWAAVMEAAHQLAEALRPLGATRIRRCQEQTGWGTCGIGLREDGTCSAARDHLV